MALQHRSLTTARMTLHPTTGAVRGRLIGPDGAARITTAHLWLQVLRAL